MPPKAFSRALVADIFDHTWNAQDGRHALLFLYQMESRYDHVEEELLQTARLLVCLGCLCQTRSMKKTTSAIKAYSLQFADG